MYRPCTSSDPVWSLDRRSPPRSPQFQKGVSLSSRREAIGVQRLADTCIGWKKRRTIKLDGDEKELLESVERREWKSSRGGERERTRYARYAKATFRKDRRLNIRLSSKDLEAIQKRALAEGLPYQTLIASVLHKYAAGRLKDT